MNDEGMVEEEKDDNEKTQEFENLTKKQLVQEIKNRGGYYSSSMKKSELVTALLSL